MAAVRDGRLLDYALHRPGAPDLVGAVLRGRITAKLPALAGAFVALGFGADGFLPDSAGGVGLTQGAVVTVRVTRAAQGGKGPRLARDPGDIGAGGLGVVVAGPDALERVAALHAEAPIRVDDRSAMAAYPALRVRMSYAEQAFDDALKAQIEALEAARCSLPGGGAMTIEPTAALVAIDLDLGGGSAGRAGKAAAHEAANAGFIPELVRAIRVRNLGGAIVVDFAGLSPRRRAALGPALAEALAGDPLQPRFLGFSALGLAEILRPRIHPPLHDLLATPHAAGFAALRALAREMASNPAGAPSLHAAPDIATALLADDPARTEFAELCGRKLVVQVDRALPPHHWRLD